MDTRLVPVDLIFAYPQIVDCVDPIDLHPHTASPDSVPLPLAAHVPQIDLVRMLVSRRRSVDSYWGRPVATIQQACKDNHPWFQQARRRIRSLRWNPLREPPVVAALDRDRLILGQGLEACCLAKVLRRAWIRVRMPTQVSREWDSRPIDRLKEAVESQGRSVFYNPIHHIRFRRAKTGRASSIRLDRIRRVLGTLGEGLRGLDIGCNMGYMSHHLRRQGFDMTGIDYDEDHLAIARSLNETYRLDVRFEACYLKEFVPDQAYDITVALTVLYHMFFRQEEQGVPPSARMEVSEIVGRLDKLTRHALLWESGDRPQEEIDLIRSHSGLEQYLPLGQTRGTGKSREMGVFVRPGTEISQSIAARHQETVLCRAD